MPRFATTDADDAAKTPPESHRDLLERPFIGHLATLRPDGRIQSNPMWYSWDGKALRMTTTTARQKFRNLSEDPRATISIQDPQQPYRYLEIRGSVVAIEPDERGRFFDALADRYHVRVDDLPDRAQRVILVLAPEQYSSQ